MGSRSVPARRGFTIVELLIVIAIIALLIVMLMPALQRVRESARRTQCANNLKQIGVALGGYEASAGRFPPGVAATVWRSSDVTTSDVGPIAKFGFYYWTTWVHMLLPRLEEQAYYDGVRGPLFRMQTFAALAASGTTVASGTALMAEFYGPINGQQIQPLLCPSDTVTGPLWRPNKLLYTGNGSSYPLTLAKSNYLGMFSGTNVSEAVVPLNSVPKSGNPLEQPIYPLPPRWLHNRRAVFGFGVGTELSQVRDGASRTIAVGEHLRGVSEYDGRGAIWYNDASMQFLFAGTAPNSSAPDVLHPRRRESTGTNDAGCYGTFTSGAFGSAGKVTTSSTNNRLDLNLPCRVGEAGIVTSGTTTWAGYSSSWAGYDGAATPRSRHLAVVNVLFCDGHVATIGNEIESSTATYGTWQRLNWIDDGLPISDW